MTGASVQFRRAIAVGSGAAAVMSAGPQSAGNGAASAGMMPLKQRGPTLVVPQDFDCDRRMIRPACSEWTEAAPDDPAFAVICQGEGDDGRNSGDRG